MDTYFSVYQTTNLVNGKTYIGAHKTCDPWDDYLGSGITLTRAIKKHGRASFTKEVLAVFDNPEDMWATEKRLVNEVFVSRQDTYNACIGGRVSGILPGIKNGMYGKTHTEAAKVVMAAKAKETFKGRSYESLYGKERANALKALRAKMFTGADHSGAKNGNSKTWLITTETGSQFQQKCLKVFCVQNDISYMRLLKAWKLGNSYAGYRGHKL